MRLVKRSNKCITLGRRALSTILRGKEVLSMRTQDETLFILEILRKVSGCREISQTRRDSFPRRGGATDEESRSALDEICREYWFPLYVFVRRWGKSATDAEDITQGFFAKILEKGTLAHADEEKGKLRSFLLTALKFYFMDEHGKENTPAR